MVRRRILVFTVVLVAACTADPSPRPSATASAPAGPTGAPTESTAPEAVGTFTFERQSRWLASQPNLPEAMTGGPLLYLSTDSLLPTCATAPGATPDPPGVGRSACEWPLTTLSPNGVFVEWVNNRILVRLPASGEAISMNGSNVWIQIERPGSCAAIGADETMDVLVPTSVSTTMSNLAVVACLRGPNLAAAEAQVRAMLESATERP